MVLHFSVNGISKYLITLVQYLWIMIDSILYSKTQMQHTKKTHFVSTFLFWIWPLLTDTTLQALHYHLLSCSTLLTAHPLEPGTCFSQHLRWRSTMLRHPVAPLLGFPGRYMGLLFQICVSVWLSIPFPPSKNIKTREDKTRFIDNNLQAFWLMVGPA